MNARCREPRDEGYEGVNCAGQNVGECIKGLQYNQDSIGECWGRVEIAALQAALTLSYFGALMLTGALLGLSGPLLWPAIGPIRIFLSYRKEDSLAASDELHGWLVSRFGAENVFRDDASLAAGGDWREGILRNQ